MLYSDKYLQNLRRKIKTEMKRKIEVALKVTGFVVGDKVYIKELDVDEDEEHEVRMGIIVKNIVNGQYAVETFTDDDVRITELVQREQMSPRTDSWIVVETEYRTNYGCYQGTIIFVEVTYLIIQRFKSSLLIYNRILKISPIFFRPGQNFSPEDIWLNQDVNEHGPYSTEDEAIKMAERCRNKCAQFEGGDSDFVFVGPPFDSAQMENYDNDSEVRIEVVTEDAYDKEKADTKEKINHKIKRHKKFNEIEIAEKADSVAIAGKVHYSFPSQEYDIKAELEIIFKEMKPIEEYTNLAGIKSVMIKENAAFADKDQCFKTTLVLLSKMTSLEELHWHSATCTEENMVAFSEALSTRWEFLKVFSIPLAQDFTPEVVMNDVLS
jgi:hypothetical protein